MFGVANKIGSSSKIDVIETEGGSCLPTLVVVSVSAIVLTFTEVDSKSKTTKLVRTHLSSATSISKAFNLSKRASLS